MKENIEKLPLGFFGFTGFDNKMVFSTIIFFSPSLSSLNFQNNLEKQALYLKNKCF
jgi:hypothetical protein